MNSEVNHYSSPRRVSESSVLAGAELAGALPEPYRTIFDQAAIGIAHIGIDGRLMRVNQKLCDTLGYRTRNCLDGNLSISHTVLIMRPVKSV